MVVKEKVKKSDSIEKKANKKQITDLTEEGKLNPEQISLRISITYMLLGALWILLSDKILGLLVVDKEAVTRISMIKGWIYVLISGLLIFTLVRSSLQRLKTAEGKLYNSYQSLSEVNMELAAAYNQVAEAQNELTLQYDKLMEKQRRLEKSDRELEYMAYYDQITGVKNKISLIKRISELITSKNCRKIALMIVDIDNFKFINDTMGHSFGDQLLIKVGSRLENLAEAGTNIYRFGGDGFVLVLEDYEEASLAEKLAVRLLKGFRVPFDINGSSLFITISIGISIYPEHGDCMDELLKNADIALYKAKETGKNRIVFYNRPMHDAVSERVSIEKHLRTALINNEFELYYQPQVDIGDYRVSGLEALIRWKSPELGFVSPLRFISIAEDSHMIIPIGEWVLKNACLYIKRLHQQGYGGLSISVNISMLQLLQDDFADKVMEILDYVKLDPEYLELEITESILMESYEVIAEKLKLLKSKGIKIALDDFGKGYSSLNYLKQLPISTLKIDKSFIDTIGSAGKHKSLTNLMVRIGKTMGLSVVAEGVETQEQLDYLVKHKCDKYQGYLFSKPLTADKVIEILSALSA